MNDTTNAYRMNPAEDTLLSGDQLGEGMWVLAELDGLRLPRGVTEDDLLRRQRFRRVSDLSRNVFTGIWIDGYRETHSNFADRRWTVKKAAVDPAAAEGAQVIARICADGYSEHVRLHGPDGGKATEDGTGEARFTVEREGRLYDVTVTPRAEGGS